MEDGDEVQSGTGTRATKNVEQKEEGRFSLLHDAHLWNSKVFRVSEKYIS